MINDRYSRQYKFLPFLAMSFITISIFIHIFEQKIWMNGITVINFIGSFLIIINDIMAEIYGYKILKKVFWSFYIGRLIFFVICNLILKFPVFYTSPYMEYGYIHILMFESIWVVVITHPIIGLLALLINARLLVKWSIILKGKYFWLRSVCCSGIGELLFTAMIIPEQLIHYNIRNIIHYDFWIIFFKIFFIALFAYPASIIVDFLKIIEGTNDYRNQHDFNPFVKASTQSKK